MKQDTLRLKGNRLITASDIQLDPDDDGEDPDDGIGLDPERGLFPRAPSDWTKGAMLTVRNKGAYYAVTLHPEEEDPRHPERTLRFANTALCQAFVSHWFAREHHDPRAR